MENQYKVASHKVNDQVPSFKTFFLPYRSGGNNPYQTQLADELKQLNVVVRGIDTNPLFFHLCLRETRPLILHIHWLHAFFIKSSYIKSLLGLLLFLGQLLALKLAGIKIVWTAHNLRNHDNRFVGLDQMGTTAVARLAHAVIAHCEAAKHEIVDTFGLQKPEKVFVVPHGHYINSYVNEVDRNKAREALGLLEFETVFLFFGLIRPYKGVLELIDAFDQLHYENCKLLIVGKVWSDNAEDFQQIIESKLRTNKNIIFVPAFIPDNELQVYFNACDVVVFPYRDILTSGAVLLAMSFGKACIAPRIGCIAEVLDGDGSFLYDQYEEFGLLSAMQSAVEKTFELHRMGAYNFRLAQRFDWVRIAEETLKVYCSCF